MSVASFAIILPINPIIKKMRLERKDPHLFNQNNPGWLQPNPGILCTCRSQLCLLLPSWLAKRTHPMGWSIPRHSGDDAGVVSFPENALWRSMPVQYVINRID